MKALLQHEKAVNYFLPAFFTVDFFTRIWLFGHAIGMTFRFQEFCISLIFLILLLLVQGVLFYEKRKKVLIGMLAYHSLCLATYYLWVLVEFTRIEDGGSPILYIGSFLLLYLYTPISGLYYLMQNETVLVMFAGVLVTMQVLCVLNLQGNIPVKIRKAIGLVLLFGLSITVILRV